MTKLITFTAAAWLFAASAFAVVKYQCPMHPQIVRDEPGECPICHMDLEKVELEESHDHAHEADGKEEHGGHAAPTPGARPQGGKQGDGHVHGAAAPASNSKAAFSLPEYRQQLIGVKVVKAAPMTLNKKLRLAGRVGGGGVLAQLLELDAGEVESGQKARIFGPAGQEAEGKVGNVEWALDTLTRSFAVSIRPAKAQAWMREGVFCDVEVSVPLKRRLAIPQDAVLDTGESQVAFVRKGDRFEPRKLKLGAHGEGWVQVLEGVSEGEEVVNGANFLIDSEARFKSALSQY